MTGVLRPGDQLPTVKDVVASLAINPNTVLKAYRELEHAGLAEGRQGIGTFRAATAGRAASGHSPVARTQPRAVGRQGARRRSRRSRQCKAC